MASRGEEAQWQGRRLRTVGRPDMRPRGIVVALAVLVAVLVAAPAALAQNATQDAYCVGCNTLHTHQSGSQLPFTGLDVALVVAAGGGLIAAGYGVRRLGRSKTA